MSIISVSVPVPTSGDGPAVDIANLVGSKSIVLNGLFSGQYVLLAGHELGVLVPVLQFDAGGEASIAQTLPDAYQYVAVRAQINTRPEGSTPVTMVVNAVEGDGQNFFATLASLVPGSFGPQPSLDTYALTSSTGVEAGINVICSGNFVGLIIIEGSEDNLNWNPIGQFSATPIGRTLFGQQRLLEFNPLATPNLVRYVRANVAATISAPMTLTFGGQIPASGSTPTTSTDLAIVTTSATSKGYYLQGGLATGAVLTDALGNEVNFATFPITTNPADVICLGSSNSLVPAGGPMAVVGTGLTAQGEEVICIGSAPGSSGGIAAGASAIFAVVVGGYNLIAYNGTSFNTLIGSFLTLDGEGAGSNVMIGQFLTCGTSISDNGHNIMIGSGFSAADDTYGNVMLIAEANGEELLQGSQYNILIGGNGLVSTSSNTENCILLGSVCQLNGSTANGYFPQQIYLVGTDVHLYTAIPFVSPPQYSNNVSQVVMIGSDVTITGCFPAVATPDYSSHLVVVGDNITGGVAGTAPSNGIGYCQIFGSNMTLGDACAHVLTAGDNISVYAGSQTVVAIGSSLSLAQGTGSYELFYRSTICIGDTNTLTGPNMNGIVAIGSGHALSGEITNAIALGQGITIAGTATTVPAYCTLLGQNITMAGEDTASTGLAVAVGSNLVVGIVSGVVAIGNAITIPGTLAVPAQSVIAIGFSIDLTGDYTAGGIAIGNSATIAAGGYSIAIGTYATAVTGQCVIGANTGGEGGNQPIHNFVVRGRTPASNNFDVINASDTPVANATGLSLVYYDGSAYTQKNIKGVAVTTIADLAGKLVAYLD